MTARLIIAVTVMLASLMTAPAKAEDLIVSLSSETVEITSNFTGSSISLFGAIRRDAATVARPTGYDVVIVVSGPSTSLVTRRKDRVAGLWVNSGARRFLAVPSAYIALSNRPVDEIAHATLLERFEIGTEHIRLIDRPVDALPEETLPDHVFERAFLRRQRTEGQYLDDPEGGTMVAPGLFSAEIPFPADVPLGQFTVTTYLFTGGVLLADAQKTVLVRKAGFEQIVFDLAQDSPWTYGALAVLLALFTGWLGGVVFRRD